MKRTVAVAVEPSCIAFAESLVQSGRFASVDDVVDRALELLRTEIEDELSLRDDLRRVLSSRLEGPFVSGEEMDEMIREMIAREHERLLPDPDER